MLETREKLLGLEGFRFRRGRTPLSVLDVKTNSRISAVGPYRLRADPGVPSLQAFQNDVKSLHLTLDSPGGCYAAAGL